MYLLFMFWLQSVSSGTQFRVHSFLKYNFSSILNLLITMVLDMFYSAAQSRSCYQSRHLWSWSDRTVCITDRYSEALETGIRF